MSDTCNICIEKYNNTSRKVVKCKCNFECCRSCVKKYILSKIEDTHCMSCKISWDYEFISSNFPNSFVTKEYKKHIEHVMVEHEISKLQETQFYVEKQIEKENILHKRKEIKQKYEQEMRELRIRFRENTNKTINKNERKTIVKQCPTNDCKGFLFFLKCNLCNCEFCKDCNELKNENHICNQDTIKSIELLKKDSKPCPNCAYMTIKTEGCNLMFCTPLFGGCGKAWSWSTGRLTNQNNIHNPEYFEWLKQTSGFTPRNPNDIICGREIDNYFVRQYVSKVKYYTKSDFISSTIELVRNVSHIRGIEMPSFTRTKEDNLDLRIDYMRNKIDKNSLKRKIFKRNKDNQKMLNISSILNTYISCMTDILYKLYECNFELENEIKVEIDNLILYINNCFQTTSKIYNCKQYKINEKYKFI